MSLHVLANHMASKGRGGDSMLVHMTPGEVQGLQALAFKMGGSLTINPETGLPEANFLKKMLPILAGAALNFFAPGIGSAIGAAFGASGAVGTGLLVGGVTGLATGSLSKGLMAGLGAYGGAGLGEAFAGAGSQAIASSAAVPEVGGAAVREAGIAAANEGIASATPWEKMSAGFNAATKDPAAMWDFAKSAKGPLAAAGMSYMAGQEPAKLNIPTTTQSPAMIRPMYMSRKRLKPGDEGYQQNAAGSPTGGYFQTDYTVPEPYPAAASGGIVALADGGLPDDYNPTEDWQMSRGFQAAQRAGGQGIQSYWDTVKQAVSGNQTPESLQAAMKTIGASQSDIDLARRQLDPAQNNAPTVWQLVGNPGEQSSAPPPTSGAVFGGSPTPTAAPSPVFGGTQFNSYGMPGQIIPGTDSNGTRYGAGIQTLADQTTGQDLSGTVAGAFVGPNGNVITYDNTGKQTDTGRPASALNEYLTGAQQSGPGSFVRGLSWGVSPEEDARSVLKLKDYARANGLNEEDLLRTSGLENPAVTATGLKSQFDKDLSGTAAGAFVGPNGTVITFDQYGKQTDTGRPASALNDYLTNPQESNVGAFVRSLSWGVSPEEDAKSSKALYDYAKSKGLSASELIKQSGLENSGITAQGLQSQWAQWNVAPVKPVDPYKPGSPIITPPPGKAPIPAPSVPVNPPKPPGWTGITGTPIPPKPTPTGGIPTLTTLTGDPYGLTPTAEKFTPPTRTGRSKEIYDYLSGKTATAPPSKRVRSEAKAPAPAPESTESKAPKVPDPAQQPVINDIYDFIHTLNWGTPEADAVAAPKLSAEASKKGWSIEQLSTASGFSVEALRKMFDKYGVSTPPPAASPAPPPEQGGSYAYGGMTRMAGGGLGSLGGYSDGGQLLRGPGDGVSDHIPATIGDKQPARLADGEFVVPARIVSELGNGSTEAGARSLYRMMDRVQAGRKKSIGKGKVAVNSRAENYLPA